MDPHSHGGFEKNGILADNPIDLESEDVIMPLDPIRSVQHRTSLGIIPFFYSV